MPYWDGKGSVAKRADRSHCVTPQQTVTTRHRVGAERRPVSGWPSIAEPLRFIIGALEYWIARSRAGRGRCGGWIGRMALLHNKPLPPAAGWRGAPPGERVAQ